MPVPASTSPRVAKTVSRTAAKRDCSSDVAKISSPDWTLYSGDCGSMLLRQPLADDGDEGRTVHVSIIEQPTLDQRDAERRVESWSYQSSKRQGARVRVFRRIVFGAEAPSPTDVAYGEYLGRANCLDAGL